VTAEDSNAGERLSLMIDIARCTGCKSCEVACKQEHGLGSGVYRNRVLWLTGEAEAEAEAAPTPVPTLDFLNVTCQHCERPACLRACPVSPKALSKDPVTGVVTVNEDRCTGCGECVVACPYGAIGYDPIDHHAVKCDLCADRRAEGLGPACASVCPGKAIQFGKHDVLVSQAADSGRSAGEHDPFLMGPGTVYLEPLKEGPAFSLAALARRNGPALMDDPDARAQMGTDPTEFPYRHARADRKPNRVEAGGCALCFNCCTTKFHFRDDKLVRITGNEEDPLLEGRVCPKSQLSVQLHTSDKRLTEPMKRVGKRGENKFEPISWDQALDEIAEKLKALRDKYGSEALALFSGTRTGIMVNRGYLRLFAQMWGTPNIESTEAFCSAGKNMAYTLIQGVGGSGNSYTEGDMGSAEMYVFIGDNQAETRPVYFGMINDWRLRNGARMVAVDPRFTVTASKADEWLAIRPGADMALGLALIHHIFANDLHDAAFCESDIMGWSEWRDFVLEKNYDADWAAPITDLPADAIRRLATDIAKADGCVIFGSRGLNQHSNSLQTNRVFMFLAAMTGNWGRAGGAYFNVGAGVPIEANAPMERRGKIERPKIQSTPVAWADAIRTSKPYPLKGLITSNNPLAMWPDQTKAREALESLDLLVHVELFPNETTAYADYVLPAATGIEKGEIGRSNDDRRIVWIDQMMDPPGNAKPDGWIWTELGKRLGFDDVMKEEYKDSAFFWDDALIDNDHMRGVTQKRLHSVPYRWVRFPVADETAPEIETLYLKGTTAIGKPEGHRFPSKSGKLEFWSPDMETKFNGLGLSAFPEFYGEREQLIDGPYMELLEDDGADGVISTLRAEPTINSPGRIVQPSEHAPGQALRDAGYDTELVTGRPPAPQFHAWTHYAWQAQEMWPDLYMQIHPEKAVALGIEDGKRVKVETSHGEIEARAWVTTGIRKTSVFIPIGWGEQQPYHPWRPVNYLTDKAQRDPLSGQTNLKTYLCRVSPA
jgi:anaerobic selenocysteine-containing dehydrogenase/Fe-S-cluster-containing dehydrogenase component